MYLVLYESRRKRDVEFSKQPNGNTNKNSKTEKNMGNTLLTFQNIFHVNIQTAKHSYLKPVVQ